tara:strand:+ start:8155 stop:9951 length:1797 start_codon:yes stop_codon:yes gene_type:complete
LTEERIWRKFFDVFSAFLDNHVKWTWRYTIPVSDKQPTWYIGRQITVNKLDRYLKPLSEKRAEELHLYADVPPTYLLDQKPIRELDQTFSNDEILEYLSEILGANEMAELEEKRRLNYQYTSQFGVFRCQLRWTDGDLKTRFTVLHGNAPVTAAPATAPPPTAPPLTATPSFTPPPGSVLPPGSSPSHPPMPVAPVQHAVSAAVASEHNLRSTQERAIISSLMNSQLPKEIDRLFRVLLQERGSDLHLSSEEKPIIRVDGALRRLEHLPILTPEQIAQLLAPIIPERNRIEFIEKWDTDFAYEVPEVGRFRANIFMDRKGVGAVFRLIPSKVVTSEQLALPKSLTDLCFLSKGLVLVTGPTGSGKSTTLCALIDLINRTRDDHIITIEDPIEFVHENKRCLVNQREINVHTNSFKAALRASLREDPDIILVGELRDLETVAIAIETAETGHLVFGTLHTTSAMSTVDRVIDQFPGDRQEQIRMMLSNSLKAVVSQTLLKKKTGGRIAAMEILLVTHGVANLIRERKIHQIQTIMQTSRAMGMQVLNDVLFDYVKRDLVDVKDAYTKSIDKLNFLEMLEAAHINTDSLSIKTGTGDQLI